LESTVRQNCLLGLATVPDNAAMPTEPPQTDAPKRKRRWFQFSLRTLMIVTALVAVSCGLLGSKIEQKRRQLSLTIASESNTAKRRSAVA
jgi:hypothetical protein